MDARQPGETHKPTTLQDVARAANVSIAAISQALNNVGSLSAETRSRIRSTAQDLGYVPNRYAASLRKNLSMVIGYVANTETDPITEKRWAHFYGRQLSALVRAAGRSGYTVTVIPDDRPDLLALARVDALYLADVLPTCSVLAAALEQKIPLVTYEFELAESKCVTVFAGYDRATIAALDALRERGAQRIGLLTEEQGYPSDEIGADTYVEWCRQHDREPIIVRANYSRTNLHDKLEELTRAGVDAIFSFYEEGPAIYRALPALGIVTPRDVQVIALCLEDCDENTALGMSHVCVHPDRAPDLVVDSLVALVGGVSPAPARVDLPISLVLSDSTRSAEG